MPLLYIKLGTATEYLSQRQDFYLDSDHPATILDYSNLDADIITSLNAGLLTQISESDYYNFISSLTPATPINVDSNYLLTLTRSLSVCPINTSVLFIMQNGLWYKLPWSVAKSCIAATINPFTFEDFMGSAATIALGIIVNATTITHAAFVGKNTSQIDLNIGGTWIPGKDPGDGTMFFTKVDDAADTITISSPLPPNGTYIKIRA